MSQIRKKSIQVLILGLFILTLMAGCGKQQEVTVREDERTPKDESLTVVGVSQLGSESVWRTANTASIRKVFCKDNGYFLIFNNARQKQENQIKALRGFISQRVDYIVFSPITEDGWDTVLKEAKAAEIPVILMDRSVNVKDESLYTSWVGSDFTEEGRKAGEWLAEYLKGKKFNDKNVNIVVLQGTKGSTSMLGRTEGFDAVAGQQPDWKILEQVDGDFTTMKGKEEMRKLLQKYEDIDVVVSQNDDMTFGALEAIDEAGKTTGTGGDIIIISFDATKTALEKVKAGVINADVECNPQQGKYIEEVIRIIERGEVPEKTYNVEEKVFTQKNVMSVLDDRTY